MTQYLGTIPLVANTPTSKDQLPQTGMKGLIIGNESGLSVIIFMDGTSDSKSLYPGTVDFFPISSGFSGTVLVQNASNLNNINSWPSSFLQFDAVGNNENVNLSAYPLTLPRLTNVGNVVNTTGGSSNSIQNDNNVAGTSIVEATVSGDGQSAVSLTNDAKLTLGSTLNKGSFLAKGPVTLNDKLTTLGDTSLAQTIKFVNTNPVHIQQLNGADFIFESPASTEVGRLSNAGIFSFIGNLSASTTTTVNGSISGTLTYSFPLWGPGLKVCMITLQGFNGTVVTVNFPSAMARSWFWVGGLGGGTQSVQPRSGVTAVNARIVTALAVAGGSFASALPIHQGSIGDIEASIDNLQITVGGVTETAIWFVGM